MKTVKLETMQEYEARTGKKYNSLIVAANNVRTELKAAFPGVKFSVRTSRFAGGDSLDVEWIDGPTTKQVDIIVNKYSAGSFDGMIDLYEYKHDEFNTLYGDAKYVGTSRRYSVEFLTKVAQIVKAEYGKDAPGIINYSNSKEAYFEQSNEYINGGEGSRHWNMQEVSSRKATELSATQLEEELTKTISAKVEAIIAQDEAVIELDTIKTEPASTDIEIESMPVEEPFNLFSWGMAKFQAVYELVS